MGFQQELFIVETIHLIQDLGEWLQLLIYQAHMLNQHLVNLFALIMQGVEIQQGSNWKEILHL